jgi:hypothetical protein
MPPERWRKIEGSYHLARERGLAALSGSNPGVRRAEERFPEHDKGNDFLDRTAGELYPEPANVRAGSRIGAYRVEAFPGAASMGEVYKAEDTRLWRRVALKVLPGASVHDYEHLARFRRKAGLPAQSNHPNITQIYGAESAYFVNGLLQYFRAARLWDVRHHFAGHDGGTKVRAGL